TRPVHGDEFLGERRDLLPQVQKMSVEGVAADRALSPKMSVQVLAGDGPSAPFEEERQDLELRRREVDVAALEGDAANGEIDVESERRHRGFGARRPDGV